MKNAGELQELFTRQGLIGSLMRVMEECRLPADQKRSIIPVVISRISLLLRGCSLAQAQMERDDGYRFDDYK